MPPDPPPTLTVTEIVGFVGCAVLGMTLVVAVITIVYLLAAPRSRP